MAKLIKNIEKKEIISCLKKAAKDKNKEVYNSVAKTLSQSTRLSVDVNLSKLEKLNYVTEGSIVIVPGKVLGTGTLNKKITIYAYSYSTTAKTKLKNNIKTLVDFCNDKIDYKLVKIIK